MKKDWDAAYKEKGIIQADVHPLVEKAIELFKKENVQNVLDLGCGTGRHPVALSKEGFKVIGYDISDEALRICKRELKKENIENVKIEKADMREIPEANETFDAVISILVIFHGKMADIKKAVSEVQRVLAKDGLFVVNLLSTNDPRFQTGDELEPGTKIRINDHDFDVPHHFFSEEEAKELFSEFEILEYEEREVDRKNTISKFNKGVFWDFILRKK